MSLTVAMREDLAHATANDADRLTAEAAALIDLAGTLRLRGGATGTTVAVVVRCPQGAVARRLRSTLVDVLDVRPALARTQGSNLRGADGYLVEVTGPPLRLLGVLDGEGRPVPRDVASCRSTPGYLAGALMAAGTLGGAGGPVHLEIRVPGERLGGQVADLVPGARLDATRGRVVVKSGDQVGDLLVLTGAHQTFLEFDRGRMRRGLRRQVNREVNADRANLGRATAAAAKHVSAIEALVAEVGWGGLPPDLVPVALARIANPEASLADLGELVDPPIGKATVHRRLRTLMSMLSKADG